MPQLVRKHRVQFLNEHALTIPKAAFKALVVDLYCHACLTQAEAGLLFAGHDLAAL